MIRRICVKGTPGSGKSTLARALANHLRVPWVELDALHHGPNWKSASASELQASVEAALNDDRGWVVDGNYDAKLGTSVMERAELIIWLDLPLQTKLARLFRRTALRVLRNEILWNGNRETLKEALGGRDALFVWAVRTHFRHRRDWPSKVSANRWVRLRSPKDVRAWFEKFCIEAFPVS